MTGSSGEMPFLDHLEELRSRILRSLGAVVLACGFGLWLVQRFQLVSLLKGPIAPYLTDGKLVVTSPTDPVMIVLKLGFLVGLVLASPIILWQTWAFLAPALYEREKKALVPSLFVGLVLFLTGVVIAYLFVVPQALPDRSHRTIHHLRFVLRLRAADNTGSGIVVRAPAGHHHPVLAGRGWSGGA
jgi:sec-independent protein translocase protein TatC